MAEKLIATGVTFRRTRRGWRPDYLIDFIGGMSGIASFGSLATFIVCLLDFAFARYVLVREEGMSDPFIVIASGVLFVVLATIFGATWVFESHLKSQGKTVEAPSMWDKLPRSAIETLAPLEIERTRLMMASREASSILEDLSENSLRRPDVEARIKEIEDEESAIGLQVKSIIDEIRQESEIESKMAEIESKTRRELAAEAKADAWLSQSSLSAGDTQETRKGTS